jgi:hypothetical protein
MAPSSRSCAICPMHAWEDRRELWAQWLLLPAAVGVQPAALSAGVGQMTTRGCGTPRSRSTQSLGGVYL